jgi:glycosyltransferase involved in cell wall biosynthesis
MRRLRILHLRKSEGLYGAERIILALAEHVSPDSWIGCVNDRRSPCLLLCDAAAERGLRTLELPCARRLDPALFLRILRAARRIRADLIHSHGFKTNFYAVLAGAVTGVPVVVTQHGWTRRNAVTRAWERVDLAVMAGTRRVVAVSNEIAAGLGDRSWIRRKTRFIPNGVEMPRVTAGRPDGRAKTPVFAAVGRLSPEKGHSVFLDAAAAACRRGIRAEFWILGGGDLLEALGSQASKLGIAGRVRFLGFRKDMENLYPAVDAVVLPSLREGLPMVLLEAMAHGKPVIATAVGEIPRVIRSGVEGLLVPPSDAGALGDAMLGLAASPARRLRMGRAGRKRVRAEYSAAVMARRYRLLYEDILKDNG